MAKLMIHHICIQTTNYKKSLDFYTKILGFEIIKETENFHNREYNTWLRMDSFMIELQTNKNGEELNSWSSSNAGIVHVSFQVDNVHDEYKRIKELGYNDFKIKNNKEICEVEQGYIFKIKAPEGTEIEIIDLMEI